MGAKLARWLRWGIGGTIMVLSQFAQWVCLLMMAVTLFIAGTALFSGNWNLLGTAALAFVQWGLGAFVAGVIQHYSVHLLPD